jgi:hypothetical protein
MGLQNEELKIENQHLLIGTTKRKRDDSFCSATSENDDPDFYTDNFIIEK